MSETAPDSFAQLTETCTQNADALATALGQALGASLAVEPGESGAFATDALPSALAGPGLIFAFQIGAQGAIGLLPATLPLPEWCRDTSAGPQLQQLADQCARCILPAGMHAQSCAALFTESLQSALMAAGPTEASSYLKLRLTTKPLDEAPTEGQTAGEPSESLLYLVWPVDNAPAQLDEATGDMAGAAESFAPASTEPATPHTAVAQSLPPLSAAAAERLRRLRHLPVSVIVRLAEKKIEMGQLLALSPGAMITFNKSCEDLLDLYVNNHLYCRGEAVKIGEKFGLKVNQVGVVPVRTKSVLNS